MGGRSALLRGATAAQASCAAMLISSGLAGTAGAITMQAFESNCAPAVGNERALNMWERGAGFIDSVQNTAGGQLGDADRGNQSSWV